VHYKYLQYKAQLSQTTRTMLAQLCDRADAVFNSIYLFQTTRIHINSITADRKMTE